VFILCSLAHLAVGEKELDDACEDRCHKCRKQFRTPSGEAEVALERTDRQRAPEVERATRRRAKDRDERTLHDCDANDAPHTVVFARREEIDVTNECHANEFDEEISKESHAGNRRRTGQRKAVNRLRNRMRNEVTSEREDHTNQRQPASRPCHATIVIAQYSSQGKIGSKVVPRLILIEDEAGAKQNCDHGPAIFKCCQRRSSRKAKCNGGGRDGEKADKERVEQAEEGYASVDLPHARSAWRRAALLLFFTVT